jgi:hypothetical protein
MQPRGESAVYRLLLLPLVFFSLAIPTRAGEFRFKDGDRVALVGSTLIEREQKYGYWELALTTRHPDKNITFRNLGWSGDTVWGESRVGFDLDNPQKGFERLVNAVLAVKPTVIVAGYGTNESFAGEAGLPRFKEGLNKLLDAFAATKARIVLLSPSGYKELPPSILNPDEQKRTLPPIADPDKRDRELLLYRDAIRAVAKERGNHFVDLYEPKFEVSDYYVPLHLTDDGTQLNEFGYWRFATALEEGLGFKGRVWSITMGANDKEATVHGDTVKVKNLKLAPVRFDLEETVLTVPWPHQRSGRVTMHAVFGPPPRGPIVEEKYYWFNVDHLPPGKYELRIDGQTVVSSSAMDWRWGFPIDRGPQIGNAEKLRQLIIEKNQLFFHRYRPQNETYLFGFRKYEQGNNAVEVPQFDALIEAKEKEIAKLRVPVKHLCELVPVK